MHASRTSPMRVGDLAKKAQISAQTLRLYESRNLLTPSCRVGLGGYRYYTADALERLQFIRRARELGFSLDDIGALLSLSQHAGQPCGKIRDQVQARLAAVDRQIADLSRMRAALKSLLDCCSGKEVIERCSIIASLSGRPVRQPEPHRPRQPRKHAKRGRNVRRVGA